MYTHEVGFEDFLGYWYAEVEITFEIEPEEPPCMYSNGNGYPGCSRQVHVIEARVLSLTGTTLDVKRDYLYSIDDGETLSDMDAKALARAQCEVRDGWLVDDLVESV